MHSLMGIGYVRFSADGSRASESVYIRSSTIMVTGFDPAAGRRVTAGPVIHSPTLAWRAPSAAADWLLFARA